MRDPYEELGVAKDADDEVIKAAYKKKVKESHPDKAGGDREAFEKVQSAYMILRDPEKRDHYDKTGEEKAESKEMHLSIIASLFEQLLARSDLPYNFDYVKTIRDSLASMYDETGLKLNKMAKDIAKLEKIKGKFHRKAKKGKKVGDKGPSNFFKQAIEFKIKEQTGGIKKGEELKLNITRALEVIDDYEFEIDAGPPPPQSNMDSEVRDAFASMFRNMRGGGFGS